MTVVNEIKGRLEAIANFYKKGCEVSLDNFQKSKDKEMKDKYSSDFFWYQEAYQKIKYLELILENKEFSENDK